MLTEKFYDEDIFDWGSKDPSPAHLAIAKIGL
jgi:hypothetical protein